MKQQYLIFAIENKAKKSVELFCNFTVDVIGSNFHPQKFSQLIMG